MKVQLSLIFCESGVERHLKKEVLLGELDIIINSWRFKDAIWDYGIFWELYRKNPKNFSSIILKPDYTFNKRFDECSTKDLGISLMQDLAEELGVGADYPLLQEAYKNAWDFFFDMPSDNDKVLIKENFLILFKLRKWIKSSDAFKVTK